MSAGPFEFLIHEDRDGCYRMRLTVSDPDSGPGVPRQLTTGLAAGSKAALLHAIYCMLPPCENEVRAALSYELELVKRPIERLGTPCGVTPDGRRFDGIGPEDFGGSDYDDW